MSGVLSEGTVVGTRQDKGRYLSSTACNSSSHSQSPTPTPLPTKTHSTIGLQSPMARTSTVPGTRSRLGRCARVECETSRPRLALMRGSKVCRHPLAPSCSKVALRRANLERHGTGAGTLPGLSPGPVWAWEPEVGTDTLGHPWTPLAASSRPAGRSTKERRLQRARLVITLQLPCFTPK